MKKSPVDTLAETAEELRSIRYALDQSSIVAITNLQGVIEYVNDKFTEISKYSREELIGKTHRVINSNYHSKEYMGNLWKTILSGKVWRGELRNRAKDGSFYWVDTTITPVLDKFGKPVKFIAIRNDITKRKELEQQKDEFLAIASHELKTPITSIKGYVQLLERYKQTIDPKLTSIVDKIDKQVGKLTLLISDLLDVTKIEAGKLQFREERFDINELTREVSDDIQLSSNNHKIIAHFDRAVLVQADRDRISQVITNLLTNAIKYSPDADKIIVSTKIVDNQVMVTVQDFGIGIQTKDLAQVFQKFFRSSYEHVTSLPGLGLGLYISAEIIRRHKGKIWVESNFREGSTFSFALPIANFM